MLYNPRMKKLKIFLCHSSGDKPQVRKLNDLLLKSGAAPWLDENQLLPGQDWDYEIKKALDASDVILLCLSKSSVDKEGYVQREIRLALDRAFEMPEGRIFLIPARLEECEVPYRVRTYQWVDLFVEGGVAKLIKSLNLRAAQIKVAPLTSGGALKIGENEMREKTESKPAAEHISINIDGDVNGNIVIGNNNEINS